MGTPPSREKGPDRKGAADYPEIVRAVNRAGEMAARKFTRPPASVVFLRG